MASRNFFYILTVLYLSISSNLMAETNAGRRLLGLIDYIRGDYPEAVKKGVVVDAGEYKEMMEFSEAAEQICRRLAGDKPTFSPIRQNLQALRQCILDKCDYSDVLSKTATLKEQLIAKLKIPSSPATHPDRALGKQVFEKNCANCHGVDGRGDGPGAKGLKPKPRSFHDVEYMALASPFKFYNSIETGIEGTAMLGYSHLSPVELWSVSFYMLGLRYEGGKTPEAGPVAFENSAISLPLLSKASDEELHTWLTRNLAGYAQFNTAEQKARLAQLRLHIPYDKQLPLSEHASDVKKNRTEKDLQTHWDFLFASVGKAKEQFHSGHPREAQDFLLDAYLEGFEHVEAPLALVDKSLKSEIERTFSVTRTFAGKGDAVAFDASLAELEKLLQHAHAKLFKKSEAPTFLSGDFLSALLIILREGFEAFLIIVALLMIVKNMGAPEARKWIHGGWMSAIIAGIIAYFLFEKVLNLSGAAKETIEAFCTGLAVLMLFYTGFWLLSQSEQKRWQQYLKEKTNRAISSRRLWVLSSMSFIAVFREAAETVLFYSALLSSSQHHFLVAGGFFTGLVTLLLACLAILKFNVRMPLKQFFQVTSALMVLLSVILAGKTVNELVEAGYLKASPIDFLPAIDFLGLYPIWETVVAQGLLLLCGAIVATFMISKRGKSRSLLEQGGGLEETAQLVPPRNP